MHILREGDRVASGQADHNYPLVRAAYLRVDIDCVGLWIHCNSVGVDALFLGSDGWSYVLPVSGTGYMGVRMALTQNVVRCG